MKQVKIFTVPMCSQCIRLKEFLNFNGIEFEEVNLHRSEEANQEVVELTDQAGAPVTKVGDDHVIGFNKFKLVEMLEENDFEVMQKEQI